MIMVFKFVNLPRVRYQDVLGRWSKLHTMHYQQNEVLLFCCFGGFLFSFSLTKTTTKKSFDWTQVLVPTAVQWIRFVSLIASTKSLLLGYICLVTFATFQPVIADMEKRCEYHKYNQNNTALTNFFEKVVK